MEEEALQLQDLVPPEPLLRDPGLPLWVWLSIALGVVLLAWLAVRLLGRKAATPPPLADFHAQAYREALGTIEEAAQLDSREAATRISGALRHYLAVVCGDPSLYETHEEFLARHQALADFSAEAREQTATTFAHLAQLKYDKDRSGEPAELSRRGAALLENLHQQRAA